MAPTDCFLDDEASDATGGANYQHSHAGNGHNVSLPLRVASPAGPSVVVGANLCCYSSSYSDLREAMSIEKRYFTSDLSILS